MTSRTASSGWPVIGVAAQRLLDPAGVRGCLSELGVLLPSLPHLRREHHQVRGDGAGHVERRCQQRLEDSWPTAGVLFSAGGRMPATCEDDRPFQGVNPSR